MDIYIPRKQYKIICDTSDEIDGLFIHESNISLMEDPEDKISPYNINSITAKIYFKTNTPNTQEPPHYLSNLYILEGDYIFTFESISKTNIFQVFKAVYIHKITPDQQAKLSLLQCRDKLTQSQLKNLTIQSQRIL